MAHCLRAAKPPFHPLLGGDRLSPPPSPPSSRGSGPWGGRAVEAAVAEATEAEVVLEDVEHPRHLAEEEHPRPLRLQSGARRHLKGRGGQAWRKEPAVNPVER